jgi:hypothetical protein
MDVRDIVRTLKGKLHAIEDSKRHHIFFYFNIEGKQYRATKLSHSAKGQVDESLLSLISKQLRLRREELQELVACPLSREDYFRLWTERGSGATQRS